MRIDLVVQLREAAQSQRTGVPYGATTPLADQLDFAAVEIENLREAIRRLADQDATLSVCNGNVTVEMDTPLTDAEREAVEVTAAVIERADLQRAATLRGLLEKHNK